MPTRCTATTRSGAPCKAWAVRDTTPPRCAAHGGVRVPAGVSNASLKVEARVPPVDSERDPGRGPGRGPGPGAYLQPALFETHPAREPGPAVEGEVCLDTRIADLDANIAELSDYIDSVGRTLPRPAWVALLEAHSRMNVRLGRLMRDRDQIRAPGRDQELERAIDEALDALAREWGIEL